MKRVWWGGAAAIVLIAACGGGGETTKAAYVQEANAICGDTARKLAAVEVPADDDVAGIPAAAAAVVAVQRQALEQLREIEAPKDDTIQIAKWIALVDQTIDQAEVSAESQRDGDITRAVVANVNGAALDERADEIARKYGLRRCVAAAEPPTTAAPAG